jgi:hypothetical protein
MKYRIKLDGKVQYESDKFICQSATRLYFERYHFIGTDNSPEFYDWLFLSDRRKREHDLRPLRREEV